MIRSKFVQRIVGLVFFLACAGITVWIWHTRVTEGYYYTKQALFFSWTMFLGLALVLFPIDPEEFKAEFGVDKIQSVRHVPPYWWGMLFVGLLAALANWYALAHF